MCEESKTEGHNGLGTGTSTAQSQATASSQLSKDAEIHLLAKRFAARVVADLDSRFATRNFQLLYVEDSLINFLNEVRKIDA